MREVAMVMAVVVAKHGAGDYTSGAGRIFGRRKKKKREAQEEIFSCASRNEGLCQGDSCASLADG